MMLTIVIVRNNSIIHIKTPHYKGSASIYLTTDCLALHVTYRLPKAQ